ncbi:MAG: TonB-dependent receptor [Bacteroidota bacterium]|nr:TonB-dependent receptor [Bacteroidota bacterium]MDP4218456.1 TonB-dependent receptor [Bacteroidota bacterium]MDP4246610.1 TonB-dependent receptor [Bacteroidota bacterium]MDP4252986.1 TonB-dependent receptor [Bacteroidota bacterium]MDP4257165.1 TonB-dependent receptor [Bacteroidota bacterium]
MRRLPAFLLAVLTTFLSAISHAQQGGAAPASGSAEDNRSCSITGLVKYPDKHTADGATIFLLRLPDSTLVKVALSDKNGAYEFEKLRKGNYVLKVDAVGYHRFVSQPVQLAANNSAIRLPEILLEHFMTELTDVTVTGKRPLIENKIDKTVVNVDASPTNSGLSALEVLEKSPGVTVDNDGNVSLKGKQGVLILIDGKPTYLNSKDLGNYLRNLSANQLDQIEIMTQPSAKYDATGNSGIINITTKKNKNYGLNGSITSSAIQAIYFKNTNSLNINWRQGKLNFFGNFGYSYWNGFSDIWNNTSTRKDANTAFSRYNQQYTFGHYADRGQSFKTGVDYFVDKNTSIGFVVKGSVDRQKFTTTNRTDIYDSLRQFVQYNDANSQNYTPQTNLGFNLNFQKKLDGQGKAISMEADYVYYHTPGTGYSDNYLFNADKTASSDPFLLNGQLPSIINIYSYKGDLTLPLKDKSVFEAGIKTSWVRTDNNAIYTLYNNGDQKWEPDSSLSNRFIYKENINAAYVNLRKTLGKWSVQVGLRAEQTVADGKQAVGNQTFHKNYIQPFPTAYFSYQPKEDHTFGLSYGRRIERPGYDNLNPFLFQLDRYSYQQGNPELQPQFSHNIELSYNYKSALNVSLNYSVTTDIINDVLLTKKEPGDSNYTTFQTTQNIAFNRNTGLAVNYSKKLKSWWTLNLFGNLNDNYYTGVIDSESVKVNYLAFFGNFSSQFTFKKGWSAEINGFFSSKNYVSSAILANSRGMFSLGGSKQVLEGKGTVKLSLRDPLYLMSFTGNSDLNKFVAHTHSVWDNRRIILTLTYRFGRSGNGQIQHKSSAEDEQSRVKSAGQQ